MPFFIYYYICSTNIMQNFTQINSSTLFKLHNYVRLIFIQVPWVPVQRLWRVKMCGMTVCFQQFLAVRLMLESREFKGCVTRNTDINFSFWKLSLIDLTLIPHLVDRQFVKALIWLFINLCKEILSKYIKRHIEYQTGNVQNMTL
jgi:hypothetical protein